jgi:uncharacterized protein YbcI
MHQLQEDRPRGGTANDISNAVVRLMREYTGRGPTKAKTVIGRDTITVVLADTLTKGERSLVQGGKADVVLNMRHEFQLTMRDDLITAVELNMQRKVVAFMSDNHIDPDMGVEVFVLESQGDDEPHTPEHTPDPAAS